MYPSYNYYNDVNQSLWLNAINCIIIWQCTMKPVHTYLTILISNKFLQLFNKIPQFLRSRVTKSHNILKIVSNEYKYIIWTRTNYNLLQFILVIHDSCLDLNQYYQITGNQYHNSLLKSNVLKVKNELLNNDINLG